MAKLVRIQTFLVGVAMILGSFSVATAPALAQISAENTGLVDTARQAGYGETAVGLPDVIGRIINILIGLIGLILFLFILYGGIMWMIAQGDPTKVTKAQGIIYNAVIGVLVVLAAYAITNFIITQFTKPETGILN